MWFHPALPAGVLTLPEDRLYSFWALLYTVLINKAVDRLAAVRAQSLLMQQSALSSREDTQPYSRRKSFFLGTLGKVNIYLTKIFQIKNNSRNSCHVRQKLSVLSLHQWTELLAEGKRTTPGLNRCVPWPVTAHCLERPWSHAHLSPRHANQGMHVDDYSRADCSAMQLYPCQKSQLHLGKKSFGYLPCAFDYKHDWSRTIRH